MDTAKTQAATDRVYEDFEPYHEWSGDEGRLTAMLPGYRRDQLKVQVTSKPALKLMGERLITGNRWRRFSLEFPIPSDHDTDDVTATFEGGMLSIKFGKLVKPRETTTAPPQVASRPQEPSEKVQEQKPAQEDTPKAKQDKEEEARTNEVSDQKTTPQKTAQEDTPKEKQDKEEEARTNEVSDQKTQQKTVQEDTLKAKQDKEEEARTDEISDQKTPPQKTAQEDTPKAKQDKEEARTEEVSDQKTLQKEGKEQTDQMEKNKTEKTASMGRVTETAEAAVSKAPRTKSAKLVSRSITRLIDFTLCLEPSNQVDNEGLGYSAAGFNKWKKLVKGVMLILLVVGLGLYTRNAFRSSHGERNFQEL